MQISRAVQPWKTWLCGFTAECWVERGEWRVETGDRHLIKVSSWQQQVDPSGKWVQLITKHLPHNSCGSREVGNAKWEADDEPRMGHNFISPPSPIPLQLSVCHSAKFRIVLFLFFQSFAFGHIWSTLAFCCLFLCFFCCALRHKLKT